MKNIADHFSAGVTLDPRRCQFSFADGRRCRLPRSEAHPALCVAHARAHAKPAAQPPNFANGCGLHWEPAQMIDLAPLSGEFRTATDVNHALGRLFSLLAQNRIPRRNAVALGYLAQLLLQTLPGVHDELIRCLGHDAWDETLDSAFGVSEPEDQTEDETESAAEREAEPAAELETNVEVEDKASAQDKAEDHREASLIECGPAEAASERQPPTDEKHAASAQAEPRGTAPAEIAAEPEPQEFIAQLPEHWSYWKELEQNEHLRRTSH